MIAQSGIVALKFMSREYESSRFSQLSSFRKLSNVALLTFVGVALTVPLEIIENLTKIASPIDAILTIFNKEGKEPIKQFFMN